MSEREALGLRKKDIVRAFHPRTLGVVKQGEVVGLGRTYVRIDFGVLNGGEIGVKYRDVLEVIGRA